MFGPFRNGCLESRLSLQLVCFAYVSGCCKATSCPCKASMHAGSPTQAFRSSFLFPVVGFGPGFNTRIKKEATKCQKRVQQNSCKTLCTDCEDLR